MTQLCDRCHLDGPASIPTEKTESWFRSPDSFFPLSLLAIPPQSLTHKTTPDDIIGYN